MLSPRPEGHMRKIGRGPQDTASVLFQSVIILQTQM